MAAIPNLPYLSWLGDNAPMPPDSDTVLQALQAMVRAGASDNLLGAAMREWTPGFGTRAPSPRPAPAVAAQPQPPVDTAIRGAASPALRPVASRPQGPEIVNFTDPEGKKSSVSFSPEEWAQLVRKHGDAAKARAAVRATAPLAPPTERRSRWTKAQLLAPGA